MRLPNRLKQERRSTTTERECPSRGSAAINVASPAVSPLRLNVLTSAPEPTAGSG
jgi:hypothetical protein